MKIITLGKFERGINALWAKVKALVSGRGRFLSLWNCSTGLATTSPSTLPYAYKTGDYFIVSAVASGSGYTHTITIIGVSTEGLYEGNVAYNVTFSITNNTSTAYTTMAQVAAAIEALGSEVRVPASGTATLEDETTISIVNVIAWSNGTLGLLQSDGQKACITNQEPTTLTDTVTGSGSTNYKPDGSSYTGVASSTAETNDVAVDDTYYYDGTTWKLQNDARKTVTFANIAGQPSDNTNLATALSGKENASNKVTSVDASSTDTQYPSAKAMYDSDQQLLGLIAICL